jgi:hypothetical protein
VNLVCAALYVKSVIGSFCYPELAVFTEGFHAAHGINGKSDPETLAAQVLWIKAFAPGMYEELEQMKWDQAKQEYGGLDLLFLYNPEP